MSLHEELEGERQGANWRSPSEDCVVRLFALEVRAFSSQYSAEERMSYAAQNLAGESNIYPKYGDFTQACVFRTYGPWWKMVPSAPKPFRKTPEPEHLGSEDFIEVVFAERLYPTAVHVYETYNPGAVVRILGCDLQGGTSVDTGAHSQWRTLWSGRVKEAPKRARIFCPPIRKIDTRVNMIRLELNHSLLHYYTELDCVMLCGVKQLPPPEHPPFLRHKASEPGVEQAGGSGDGEQGKKKDKEGDEGEEPGFLKQLESLTLLSENDHQLFSLLPGEIIVMILGYLDFPSLGRVAQTCRLLQKHAYDSILYTEINLQPVWNMVSDRTLEGLTERCDNLQRLNMSWCRDDHAPHKTGFMSLLDICSTTLTCLQLSSCTFVNQDTIHFIAYKCSRLKDLDLSGCGEVDKVSAIHLTQLRDLERLNLYRTLVDTPAIICVIRCLRRLKHLNIGSCKLITHMGNVVEELGLHCPELRSLDVWRARHLDNSSFHKFIASSPLLEELDLGWCTDLNSRADSFTHIAEKCKNLKKLFLTANRTVCDADMLALAKHSSQLQQLDILGTREVSSEAMEKVLSSCPQLVMVDVSFCAGISDHNVENWKVKFPGVILKKSFQD